MTGERAAALVALARVADPSVAAIHPHWQEKLLPELAHAPHWRERLVATRRVERRLAGLLRARAGLGPLSAATIEPDILHVAGLDRDGLVQLARLVGAIWHGASLARLMLREEVVAMHEAIGQATHAEVYRWRERWVAASQGLPIESLRERLEQSGWQAIGAWLLAVPEPVSKRVMLRLDPSLFARPTLAAGEGPIAVALVRDVARHRFTLATAPEVPA